MDVLALLLGRRLANRESGARKIGALEGVPAMGLDALASIAYGPEAALVLLMPLGAAAPALAGWLLLPIIVLLGLLCLSYWQTIDAYRERGGAYVVARENLGTPAGLIAAVVLPQQVKQHWLQQLLHAHRAQSLRRHLARAKVPGLAIVTVPWSPEK